jgi:hypothetical protein
VITPGDLYQSPNALAPYYSAFRVGERLLLTEHSHQAWPDCGFDGQKLAWQDAAEYLNRERGVYTDSRGEILRLGPAPYLSDQQLIYAISILAPSWGRTWPSNIFKITYDCNCSPKQLQSQFLALKIQSKRSPPSQCGGRGGDRPNVHPKTFLVPGQLSFAATVRLRS